MWVWTNYGWAGTSNSKNQIGWKASQEKPQFLLLQEVDWVGLAHGPTGKRETWHWERFWWRSLGNSSGRTQTRQVSARKMLGNSPEEAIESYLLAYKWQTLEQDQAESVHVIHWQIQAPVWVDPGSVTTKTSAQYGMPRWGCLYRKGLWRPTSLGTRKEVGRASRGIREGSFARQLLPQESIGWDGGRQD